MNLSQDWLLVVGLAVSFLAAVFLAAAETSLIRISPVRAATLASRKRRGARLAGLLEDLPRVLSAILLAALLSQIAAATLTGLLAERWFGSLGVTLASIVLTLVLFVYGEAIPKTYAVRHSESVALRLAPAIAALEVVLRPLVAVLVWFADLQSPGKGITTSPTVTEDELLSLAESAASEGEITERDREMIERAFRFGDREVNDVMLPRTDVVAVDATATIEEALEVALEAGHPRIPVYRDSPDSVVGVVRLRDLAAAAASGSSGHSVLDLAAEPLAVPENKQIFELLDEMRSTGTHLAVVVDEYGGTAGIATIEDIAEELVGSLRETSDLPPIAELQPGHWSVDGALPVEDLADLLETDLPEGDWNTVAGLVLGVGGRVPHRGDEIDVEGFRLVVDDVQQRRITRVLVHAH